MLLYTFHYSRTICANGMLHHDLEQREAGHQPTDGAPLICNAYTEKKTWLRQHISLTVSPTEQNNAYKLSDLQSSR